jgi:hypothetical protein
MLIRGAVFFEQRRVVVGSVPYTTVGMMRQPFGRVPAPEGLLSETYVRTPINA